MQPGRKSVLNEAGSPIGILKQGFHGLNTTVEPARLGLNSLVQACGVLVEKGSLLKAPGYQYHCAESADKQPYLATVGIHRTSRLDGTSEFLLTTTTEIWKTTYATGGTFTKIKQDMLTGTQAAFARFFDKDFICKYPNPLSVYGTTVENVAVQSPTRKKTISSFESPESWTANAHIEDSGRDYNSLHIVHGLCGYYVKTKGNSTEGTLHHHLNPNIDLSSFIDGGIGSVSEGDDLIRIYLAIDSVANVSALNLRIGQSDDDYWIYDLTDSPEWELAKDNVLITYNIKKKYFTSSGYPAWNTIGYIDLGFQDNGKAFTAYFDLWQLVSSPPIANPMRVQLGDMEIDETWANIQSRDYAQFKEGTCSIQLKDAGGESYRDVVANLTIWVDGIASSTRDQVGFWAYRSSSTFTDANTLTLRIYTNAAKTIYYYYTWLGSALPLPSGWVYLKVRRDQFTAVGAASWSTVTRVSFIPSANGTAVRVDDLALLPYVDEETIAMFETSEGWVATNNQQDQPYVSSPLIEGQSAYQIKAQASETADGLFVFPVVIDLTTYPLGAASATTDKFSCYVYTEEPKNVYEVRFRLYGDTARTMYYDYVLLGVDLEKKKWTFVSWEMGDMIWYDPAGGAASFATIYAAQVYITASEKESCKATFDRWTLATVGSIDGDVQYVVQFETNDSLSELSEPSIARRIVRADAILSRLPISSDPRVIRMRIFRKYSDENVYRLAMYRNDNTRTSLRDSTDAADLGDVADKEYGVPYIGKDLIEHDNSLWMCNLEDPDDSTLKWPSRVARCRPGDPYAWPRPGVTDLAYQYNLGTSDGTVALRFAKLKGRLYCFKGNSIWRLEGSDETTYNWTPVEESRGLTAYHCIASGSNYIAYVYQGRVYLFDGYQSIDISENIKDILDTITDWASFKLSVYKDYLLLSADYVGWVYHVPTQEWTEYGSLAMTAYYRDDLTGLLYGADFFSLYQLWKGNSLGLAQNTTYANIITGYEYFDLPEREKTTFRVWLVTRQATQTIYAIRPYVDGVAQDYQNLTIPASDLSVTELLLPQEVLGHYLAFHIQWSSTSESAIIDIIVVPNIGEMDQ